MYIESTDLAPLVTVILAEMDVANELENCLYLIRNGEFTLTTQAISKFVNNNKGIIKELNSVTTDITKLQKSYNDLLELNKMRAADIDRQKILLDGLEKLLWDNLEDFNRLRSEYSIDEIREIFNKNLGTPRLCEECGKMFVGSSPKQRFCTVECRKKAANRRK